MSELIWSFEGLIRFTKWEDPEVRYWAFHVGPPTFSTSPSSRAHASSTGRSRITLTGSPCRPSPWAASSDPSFPILTLSVAAAGCAMVSAPVIPPVAMIQNYKAPLDLAHQDTSVGTKRGVDSTQSVLGVVSWGDGSTRAAAQDGGITTIRSADYEFFTVFGFYSKYTTVVYGD